MIVMIVMIRMIMTIMIIMIKFTIQLHFTKSSL